MSAQSMSELDVSPALKKRVLVLGGAGFIGRYAVIALREAGCEVIIGSRHIAPPRRTEASLRDCAWRQIRAESHVDARSWHAALAGIDVVINCVGILRERLGESYEMVHHRAPAALALACKVRGVRMIQVSALGLYEPMRSGFLRSKYDGEQAVQAAEGDWCIVRPSLLDAERGGFGARWIRRVAAWPVHPLPVDALGKIAALDVRDLGEALARLALMPDLGATAEQRIYEFGGENARCLAMHLAALRAAWGLRPARVLAIPSWMARLGSHICDLFHLTPFSFGHWELLKRDNSPQRNRLNEVLGRAPRGVGASASVCAPILTPVSPPLGLLAPRR